MKEKTNSRRLWFLLEIVVMVLTLKHCIFAMLVATGGFALFADAQDQRGFISLDCGLPDSNPGYYEKDTGLVYVSDADFIDTGESKSVPAKYSNGYQRQMETVRSFPEGIRNCYRINVTSGTPYLIGASFLYGNYDGKDTLPEFDVHIGANLWHKVNVTNASTVAEELEIIHIPPQNHIHVCLVKTGSTTPFISTLLFRRLNNQSYKTEEGSQVGLALAYRVNTGTTTDQGYRYPEDVYDRYWPSDDPNSAWTSLSTSQTIDNNSYVLPSVVMSTAATPINRQNSLDFDLLTEDEDDGTSQYYVYMHFAELELLKADQRRTFYISYNEEHFAGPVSPKYLTTSTISNDKGLLGGHSFSIYAVDNSTHPPILNAYEVYMVQRFLQSEANQNDIDAITILKSTYGIKRNWQGDPCTREYLWQGVQCNYDGNYDAARITLLNLSSSGLTGEIPPSISELTMIENLDLSNNNFTGSMPEFLSKLPNLRDL